MSATLHLRWKRQKSGGFRAEYELALPLKKLDIRRKKPFAECDEIRRFEFTGVTKTAKHRQPNRQVPFERGSEIGLNVKEARLELRWERTPDDLEWPWMCHYELVMPLSDGRVMRAKLGGTRRGGDDRVPIDPRDGTVETPFRDGAHARWDGATLGLKAWAVCGDTKTEVNSETRQVAEDMAVKQ